MACPAMTLLLGVLLCCGRGSSARRRGTSAKAKVTAMDLVRAGRLAEAVEAFSAQARASGAAHDYYNMALAAAQLGRAEQVADALAEALFVQPDFADAWINFGVFFQQNDEMAMALRCYRTAARLAAGHTRALALYNLGAIHLRADEVPLAHSAYLSAHKTDPALGVAADGLGSVALRRGDLKQAQALFQRALVLQPDMAESYFNLGNLERRRGNSQRALTYLETCVRSTPRGSSAPGIFWAQVYNNLGGALHALGRYEDALPAFDKAVRELPGMVMAYVNKGEALRILGQWTEAIACTHTAVELDPRHGVALSNHLMYKQNVCDWSHWEELHSRLVALLRVNTVTRGDVSEESLPTVSPYQAITFPFTPAQTRLILQAYAEDIVRKASSTQTLLTLAPPPPVGPAAGEGAGAGVLRIAYMSADFGEHTTGVNVGGMFREHDMSRTRVFAYATSPDDGSETRARVQSEAHVFRDVHDLSDAQLAFAINADGIHVLVDLNGYTLGARSAVVALRPAPLTIFDQGFAGSSGGLVAYLNADRVSAPPEHAQFYSEALMYMPFFANPLNDHARVFGAVATARPATSARPLPSAKRSLLQVPGETFVYASFNTPYKLCPAFFAAVARIVRPPPGHSPVGAVLWLLRWPGVEERLRERAVALGVNASLVSTPLLPKDSHLVTKAEVADMFLDTFAFNGHGTISQVLWAGIPALTLPGERLGQRIGATLVKHSAAPEMIARSVSDYVALARACATPRGRRSVARMRWRLEESRARSVLFDIRRYVRDYERLLSSAWDAYLAGHTPGLEEDQLRFFNLVVSGA